MQKKCKKKNKEERERLRRNDVSVERLLLAKNSVRARAFSFQESAN
jgi:hypothetical protein